MATNPGAIKFSVHPYLGADNLANMHRNGAVREAYHRMPGNYSAYLPDGAAQTKNPRMSKAGWYDTRSDARKI
jgi:hypothetical protein